MKIVKIGGNSVIVGLDWSASQAESLKEAINETVAGDKSQKAYAAIEGIDVISVALHTKLEKGIVGAAWIASSQKDKVLDFILIEPVSEKEYWMCGIKNGAAFYGSDIVGEYTKIIQQAKVLLEGGDFKLFTTDEKVIEDLAAVVSNYTAAGFENLVSGKSAEFKLKSVNSGVEAAVKLGVLVVLIAGAYFAYDWYQTSVVQQQALEQLNLQNALKQKKLDDLRRTAQQSNEKNMMIAKEKFIGDLAQKIATSGGSVPLLWSESYTMLPHNPNGWRYSKIDCVPLSCNVSLVPEKYATNHNLGDIFDKAVIDPETGIAQFTIKIEPPAASLSLGEIPGINYAYINSMSVLQNVKTNGFDINWKQPKEMTYSYRKSTVDETALSIVESDEKVNSGVYEGSFELKDTAVWKLDALANLIKEPSIVYNSLEIKKGEKDELSWNIEGKFYGTKENITNAPVN